jgi:ABC-type uncharacterized transport system substrate-binding protein
MTANAFRYLLASLLALALSACTQLQPVDPPPPERPHKDAVAIVVSSNAPAYMSVARALARRLDRDYLRYSLDNADAAVIREIIEREEHQEVIAIGRAAARAVQAIGPDRVIYCQVFYDQDLRQQEFRGVAAIPTFAMQLDHWMRLEPDLKRIGVVVSANSRGLVEELSAAANAYGLDVRHEEVTSDKQALFVYQRLIPDIDGFLFLPDTTVLSPSVIRRMMRYGVKHDISMLVYSPLMFELGGSMLVTPRPADVAEQIMALLDPVQRLTAQRRTLTDADITVRDHRVTLAALHEEITP